jgi:hypothetical protein
MTRSGALVGFVSVFLLGLGAGAFSHVAWPHTSTSMAHAQSVSCTNASLSGTYGVLAQGFASAGDGGALVPHAGVLVVALDGAGGLTIGGFMNPSPVTGTYSVNPDCSFTLDLRPPDIMAPEGATVAGGNSSPHALGVLVDGGKRFFVTMANQDNAQYFIGERQ